MSCKPTTFAAKYSHMALKNNDLAFRQGIVSFDVLLRQSNPADYYNRVELIATTKSVNALKNLPVLANYPLANDRLQASDLTYVEFADFLQQSGYTIPQVESILAIYPFTVTNTQVDAFLGQLDFYFTENIATSVNGGTCGALSNPFAKELAILNKSQNAFDLSKALEIISYAALAGPLTAIQLVLKQIVDKLKDKLLQQVNNIVGQMAGIVSVVGPMGMQVLTQFRRMTENVRGFLSDLSIEGIKSKIEQFVASAVSQFSEITPDVLMLLLFRFCQFSEMIQSFLQSPIQALKERVSSFINTRVFLDSQGLLITQGVVANGGTRIRSTDIDAARTRLTSLANGGTGNIGSLVGSNQPAAAPGLQIPAYVEDGVITEAQANAILNMNDSGIPGYCNFSDGVWNMHAKRGQLSDARPGDGYRKVKDEVWVKLIKALDMIPDLKPVTILSGYRSPEYNRRISGAARGSLHQSGMAIDVQFPGSARYEDVARYISACSIQGFGGIQTYTSDGFTHTDIGTKRSWNIHGADGTGGRWGRLIQAHLDGNMSSISNVIASNGNPSNPTTVASTETPSYTVSQPQ